MRFITTYILTCAHDSTSTNYFTDYFTDYFKVTDMMYLLVKYEDRIYTCMLYQKFNQICYYLTWLPNKLNKNIRTDK